MPEKKLISSFNIVMYIQVCDATTECFYTHSEISLGDAWVGAAAGAPGNIASTHLNTYKLHQSSTVRW